MIREGEAGRQIHTGKEANSASDQARYTSPQNFAMAPNTASAPPQSCPGPNYLPPTLFGGMLVTKTKHLQGLREHERVVQSA